jgi:non-ribosomal peptide synthetase component F
LNIGKSGITPMGRAFTGQRTCIVDPTLQPVTPGESGELCLSGSQVAQGYFNDPEQTRKQFVTLPGKGEELWYRTGDLVLENRPSSEDPRASSRTA